MKPTVLVDMDGIIVDLNGPWVWWLNGKFGLNLTGEDLTQYHIPSLLPKLGNKVYGFLNQKGLYRELEPYPGAIEGMNYLYEYGYDVMIATSPVSDPDSAADKLRWLKKWLPWLRRQNVFLCHRKELIKADIFIDDSPDNIINYRKTWTGLAGSPHILTIDWPYNRGSEVDACLNLRAGGYDDTVTAWRTMLEYVAVHRATPEIAFEALKAKAEENKHGKRESAP